MDMQYTPQQMMGSRSFQPRVRIGNWNEDIALQDTKFKDYLEKKTKGELVSDVLRQKLARHLQPMQISPVLEGGLIQFGSKLMIFSEKIKGFIGADLDTQLHFANERYQVTAAPAPGPVSRAVFTIEKVPTKDDKFYEKQGEEDIIHYGQYIRLVLCDDLAGKPLYLRSELAKPTCKAKKSSGQEVSVDSKPGSDCVWKIEYANPLYTIEMEGEPVPALTPVLIRHVQTNEFLAADNIVLINDFGKEFEVSARHDSTGDKSFTINQFSLVLQSASKNKEPQ